MSQLAWDKVDERPYASGVDRGVLFLSNGLGVVWNGITGVDEDLGTGTSQPLYFDGVKYTDLQQTAEPYFTLKAITYPDEFAEYEGYVENEQAVFLDAQGSSRFGLSYRVKSGNGYRIHLWYNLLAVSDSKNNPSTTQNISPNIFTWTISGVPYEIFGFQPTEHFIFDTNDLDPVLVRYIESLLYGDSETDSAIPVLDELLAFATTTEPLTIVPAESGIADLVPGGADLDETEVDGVYRALRNTRLTETAINGIYTLEA